MNIKTILPHLTYCFYCKSRLSSKLSISQGYHNKCQSVLSKRDKNHPELGGSNWRQFLSPKQIQFVEELGERFLKFHPKSLKFGHIPIHRHELDYDIVYQNVVHLLRRGTTLSGIYINQVPKRKNLTLLPNSIASITTMEEVTISNCNIRAIPKIVFDIPNLKKLTIRNCPIKFIQKEIGNLHNLESLILFNTEIRSLPHTIGNLSRLRYLDLLSNSGLNTIPDNIGDLVNLEHLDILDTEITRLPDTLGNLKKLRELILHSNDKLDTLPSSLWKLKDLRLLKIYHSPITELSEEIGLLINLNELEISLWELPIIPESIGNLINLRNVNIQTKNYKPTDPKPSLSFLKTICTFPDIISVVIDDFHYNY